VVPNLALEAGLIETQLSGATIPMAGHEKFEIAGLVRDDFGPGRRCSDPHLREGAAGVIIGNEPEKQG
jgi:hypothetical protein